MSVKYYRIITFHRPDAFSYHGEARRRSPFAGQIVRSHDLRKSEYGDRYLEGHITTEIDADQLAARRFNSDYVIALEAKRVFKKELDQIKKEYLVGYDMD